MLLLTMLVFVAGILTFIAPCTLPILPAYISFAASNSRTKRILRTGLFGIGLAGVFLVFGLFAGMMGAFFIAYKTMLTLLSGALFVVLGAMIILGKGIPGINLHTRTPDTVLGTIGFGAIFGLSWSGCIGPILGAVLILAANTQTAITGGILLLVYATGLLTPLIIMSLLLDTARRDRFLWRALHGRMLRIGHWEVHTTALVSGGMLIILGILFLTGAGAWLSKSPIIDRLFSFEDTLLATTNIAP